MIKGRWRPATRRVAEGAVSRESRRDVVGIRRSIEICFVARETGRGSADVNIVDVAQSAGNVRMHPRQRVTCV